MSTFSDPWLPIPDPNSGVPLSVPATPWAVYRVTRAAGTGGVMGVTALTPLPNVECEAVEDRVGDAPATAIFRYVFDGDDPDAPQNSEQALSTLVTQSQLPLLVSENDELAVGATRPDGMNEWIFDGPVVTFTMRIDRAAEVVTFAAVGLGKRAFDAPCVGAVIRENDDPETVRDVETDIIAQFNPGGWPNASPGTADSGTDPNKYPVQMDPLFGGAVPPEDADGDEYPRTFDLAMGVANVLNLNNPGGVWVGHQKRDDLDALLVAREPKDGVPFDPSDPSTYDARPFAVPDTPITGRAWPSVVRDFVKDFGFEVRWALTSDSQGNPVTSFEIFLKQAGEPKPLLLQERGSAFDPLQTNLGSADVGRDLSAVVNKWTVLGALDRYEVSLVLVPAFPSQASDADVANLKLYDVSDPAFATTAAFDAYRTWVFAEDGSKYYANLSTTPVEKTATSLDGVFGGVDPHTNEAQYVKRRRPPTGTLFSLDKQGKPLQYRVSVSKDYAGPKPGLWDGTGTWQHCHGVFHLLHDRIGVRIALAHPNHCEIGKSADPAAPFPSGILKAVQSIAAPDAQNPAFFVRLTCVIEADQALIASAARQDTSPLEAVIERQVDARDRYAKQTILAKSELNNDSGATDSVVRDDTDKATAEAKVSRTATEAGLMEGNAVIPHFTTCYETGDRISEIRGRSLGLRTDTGGSGFAPVLPLVVARRLENGGDGQYVILSISDGGLDRRRYGLKRPAPPARYVPSSQDRARSVAQSAAAIQASGFGVATNRI